MSGEPLGPADPDDWFAESGGGETDSGFDERPSAPRHERELYGVDLRLWLAGGAVVVLLVIAGLALGGAFSSDKKPAATTPPTSTPLTTTAHTPTTPAAKPPTGPTTTLKPGDTGIEVKRLQRSLVYLGYPVGKVDGDYGTATETALKKFQTAQKLTADGVLGPKTLAALDQALQTS